MTNILKALYNITKNPIVDIGKYYSKSSNRANSMGDSLESYVKDAFCNSYDLQEDKKDRLYSENFSYIGNQNNPPDIIIKNGDAIEVKKIESLKSGLALNSSYPKDKLYHDSPMIAQACRDCEDWREKDIIYAIGSVKNKKLVSLWFVYGDCYAASKDIYERIKNKISKGLDEFDGIEFSETKELGRVNKVDPLGITYLRIRGMWHIENPMKVFDYITALGDKNFEVNVLMLKSKYDSFPVKDRKSIEELIGDDFSISDVDIKSPNNPAKLLKAKLIKFTK